MMGFNDRTKNKIVIEHAGKTNHDNYYSGPRKFSIHKPKDPSGRLPPNV